MDSTFLKRIPQYIISVTLLLLLLTILNYARLLPFRIFTLLVASVALFELADLVHRDHKVYRLSFYRLMVLVSGMVLPALTLILQLLNAHLLAISHILIITIPILFVALISVDIFAQSISTRSRRKAHTFSINVGFPLAIIYIGLPIIILLYLSEQLRAPLLLGFAFGAVALFDTFSYICGRLFGRNGMPLIAVSPKKTIAGLVGGACITILIMTPLLFWQDELFLQNLPLILLILSLTLFAALMGDLFESLIKRSVSAKDSGTIVYGRGGVLDSIDSYLFALPVFAALYFVLY